MNTAIRIEKAENGSTVWATQVGDCITIWVDETKAEYCAIENWERKFEDYMKWNSNDPNRHCGEMTHAWTQGMYDG